MNQPNILWICSDQQRFDTLGCLGNPFVQTPNLDRLAAAGVVFTHAYAQSPYCTPSRAAFLTGRYPRTCRGRQNGADLPETEVLVTRLFAEAGYHNGLCGKLHLSAANDRTGRTRERRIDDGYREFDWSHHNSGMGGGDNDYHTWLAERGLSFHQAPCPESAFVSHAMTEETSQTAWCAEQACDFMRQRARDGKPWLYSVNLFDPHHGFDAPRQTFERYLARLEELPLPRTREGELDSKPLWQRLDSTGAYGSPGSYSRESMTDTDRRCVIASYWAMCDLIDRYVGQMVATLEETGLRKNTIILFSSDHGEMLGDHGIFLKGPYFYEEAIRVPLLCNGPGLARGVRREALVELVDLPQTLLDLAGLPHHPGMQGRSFRRLLTEAQAADRHREDIYCESYNACHGHNGDSDTPASATMVRTERHKLVVAHNLDTGELYDLEQDPDEFTNRWDDPGYAEVKMELLVRLTHRMAFTCDPLPERIAPW